MNVSLGGTILRQFRRLPTIEERKHESVCTNQPMSSALLNGLWQICTDEFCAPFKSKTLNSVEWTLYGHRLWKIKNWHLTFLFIKYHVLCPGYLVVSHQCFTERVKIWEFRPHPNHSWLYLQYCITVRMKSTVNLCATKLDCNSTFRNGLRSNRGPCRNYVCNDTSYLPSLAWM